MVLTYITAAILLLLSPIIGKYALKYVYPDVKTFMPKKKWVLYSLFGLVGLAPAVIVAFSDMVVSIYSPIGPGILESGGNAMFLLGLYGGFLYLNMSIVEYKVVHRKTGRTVGLPKHVISYGIKEQMVRSNKEKRVKEISRISSELESVLKEDAEVKPLLTKIRLSVAKERAGETGNLADMMRGDAMESLKEAGGQKEEAPETEEPSKESKEIKVTETKEEVKKEGPKAPEEVKELLTGEDIKIPKIEKPKAEAKEITPETEEREKLVAELEKKLKKATEDAKNKEKTDSLLNELKDRIREDREESIKEGEYFKGDVDEITQALRAMKTQEPEEEEPASHGRKHGKSNEGVGDSVISYEKAYPGRRKDDVLKDVVGDVRQQLTEPSEKGEEEAHEGGRWYDKKAVDVDKAPSGEGAPVPGGDVELFEDDMSFGDGMGGEMGEFGDLGGDFGDLGDLEDVDQNLESSGFDGMFVEMNDAKGGCPNCNKKGSSVVYCSNCGKPLCSNCALSVEGSEEFIKYKCPHCREEFAMKRRMPS